MRVDRTVHASTADVEVVRYSRSTKWFVEDAVGARYVTVDEAAQHAANLIADGGTWHQGLAGGTWFDRKVHDLSATTTGDCPLAAAIRRGHDNDELMWRLFDDMAGIVDKHPELADDMRRRSMTAGQHDLGGYFAVHLPVEGQHPVRLNARRSGCGSSTSRAVR